MNNLGQSKIYATLIKGYFTKGEKSRSRAIVPNIIKHSSLTQFIFQ